HRDHPAILGGALLTVVSPAVEGRTRTGLPCGAMSGLLQRRLPSLIQAAQAVPYAAHLVEDCEARAFVLLRLALARTVSGIGTPDPPPLIRLASVARPRPRSLPRARQRGALGVPGPGVQGAPGGEARPSRRALEAALRPRPARARELAAATARRGTLSLEDAWPGLALLGCWLGGHAGRHAARL